MVETVEEIVTEAPSCEVTEVNTSRNNGNRRRGKRNDECGSISLNNTFRKFGVLGFNNKS